MVESVYKNETRRDIDSISLCETIV